MVSGETHTMCDNERKYALCNGFEGLTYRNSGISGGDRNELVHSNSNTQNKKRSVGASFLILDLDYL